jgi:hypothetical protein
MVFNSAYIVKILSNFFCILCYVFFHILKYRCISKSLCICSMISRGTPFGNTAVDRGTQIRDGRLCVYGDTL